MNLNIKNIIECRRVLFNWTIELLTNWLPEYHIAERLRGHLYRLVFNQCGKRLRIRKNVKLISPHKITIGNFVNLGQGCWLDGTGGLVVEDYSLLGPYVVMTSSLHTYDKNGTPYGELITYPVKIGRGCWIGAHCTISAGVSIGKGTIVGANSVVTHSLPDNVFAAGVPAKVISLNKK